MRPRLLSMSWLAESQAIKATVGKYRWRFALLVVTVLGSSSLLLWWVLPGSAADSMEETETVAGTEAAVAVPLPRPTATVSFQDGCVSARCHAPLIDASHVHPTTRAGRCDICHAEDSGDHIFPVEAPESSTCRSCHQDHGVKPFQHELLSGAGCTGCHRPHSSSTPDLLRGESVAATCRLCHAQAQGLLQHAPYGRGECLACHDPHESDFPNLLRGGLGIDHCRLCHQEKADQLEGGIDAHLRLDGACLACHSAHATDYAQHLTARASDQCLGCHEEIREVIDTAPVSHEAVLTGRRCLACHDPHLSGNPMMLREDQTRLCLECHGDSVIARDGRIIPDMTAELTGSRFSHGPVGIGQCTACHNVHGSEQELLLTRPAPSISIGDFDIDNYALCFQCHTPALVLEEKTWHATSFRDGDINLHFTHLRTRFPGRTCTTCHSAHGSENARHVEDTVSFEGSDWQMPIRFRLTETGGSCAPGCHQPLHYDRSTPARTRQDSSPGEGR